MTASWSRGFGVHRVVGSVLAGLLVLVSTVDAWANVPKSVYALYWGTNKGYTMLWPNGQFTVGKPVVRPDGSFDQKATLAETTINRQGTFTIERNPKKEGTFLISGANGSGRPFKWKVVPLGDGSGWGMHPDRGRTLSPVKKQEFVGTVSSTRSITAGGGRHWSGTEDSSLTASGTARLEFKPGKRFHLKNTALTVASQGARKTAAGGWESHSIDGEGTYRFEGIFLVLKFSDGRVVKDVFQFHPPKLVVFGSRQYTGVLQ